MTSTQNNERYEGATIVAAFRADTRDGFGCEYCGQGIINVTEIRLADGTLTHLGPDCAIRVGLSDEELKAHFAELYAEERQNRNRKLTEAQRAANQAEALAHPAAAQIAAYYAEAQAEYTRRGGAGILTNGFDGTANVGLDYAWQAIEAGRWLADGSAGSHLIDEAAAAIATFKRAPFRQVTDPATLIAAKALFDLDGNLLDARLCSTRYGPSWRVRGGWFNPSKAQDEAKAVAANRRKGFHIGTCLYVAGRDRSGRRFPLQDEAPVVIEDNGLDIR